jgi:hypothetical protein
MIRALQIAGWRYSTTREAWVHRAFHGRVGPVFIDPQYYNHPGVTDIVDFGVARPFRAPEVVVAEGERTPLPQRQKTRDDLPRVKVRLSESEEPRVVAVDGKPPRRGVESLVAHSIDNVVPLKSAAS